tara:strand:+ start:21 stop:725 length:705 start_codon:yes stop_codon:yes gene_type:complete
VCVDANAGARAQAREQARQKNAAFEAERLKFYNKETAFARAQTRNVIGLSRARSDAYAKAIAAQGKGRKQLENASRRYFRSKGTVNEGGRSRTFGRANYQGLLAAQSEVESVLDNVLGRNLAYAETGAVRQFRQKNAAARESLGLPATYGAPIMMPPTNRLGGALQIAGQVASIYSGFGGASIFKNFGSRAAAGASASALGSSSQFIGSAGASAFTGGGLGLFDYGSFPQTFTV